MIVHLIDGTYELFRHFYGQRRFNQGKDKPYGAVAGVLHTVLELIETSSGARIQLEGNRIPLTHSKDVIQALS